MAEICINLSDELQEKASKFPNLALAKIFERALESELEERTKRELILSAVNKILENSEMTDEDCEKLGRIANEGMFRQLKKEGLL